MAAAAADFRTNNGAPGGALETKDFSEDGTTGGKGGAAASSSSGDKDRKIGHRRVNEEGEVSYKKIHSNQLVDSIQLGIRYSVGVMTKADERDLLMQDFMTVDSHVFPRSGGITPAHSYTDFKFNAYAPLAFRYFLNLFGIQRDDFMMSLCNEQLRELSNPGASGSLFFLTNDDEFIIKTVQHKEAEFLQKLLPGYYMNLNQNPHTLLPKFFGMFCYQCNQKNIRLTVMNNLLPSAIKMHLKFDLKGSTYKRRANKRERAKNSPTYKDLDFNELLPEGLLLEQETYNALITTMRRDCRVLESFRIMDYSLLVGIHNLDSAAKEEADRCEEPSPTRLQAQRRARERAQQQKQKLVAHSTAMESIQAQTEPIDDEEHLPPGGIPARNHKGERLLLYLGIIDILQSFRMRKKIEHTIKAIIHDGDTVSVHRPGFYAHRFLDFMADKVFKKIPSPLRHTPSKKGKRDSSQRKMSAVKSSHATAAGSSDSGGAVASSSSSAAVASTSAAAGSSFTMTAMESTLTTSSFSGASSKGDLHNRRVAGQRPDVVPGLDEADGDDASAKHYQRKASSRQEVPGSPGRTQKPTNRQHVTLKQQSVEHFSSSGTSDHGTPSRLSVGTAASSGWSSPTAANTWTEGTPSYTPSSLSGASSGLITGVGNASAGGVKATSSAKGKSTSSTSSGKIETCSYQETEM